MSRCISFPRKDKYALYLFVYKMLKPLNACFLLNSYLCTQKIINCHHMRIPHTLNINIWCKWWLTDVSDANNRYHTLRTPWSPCQLNIYLQLWLWSAKNATSCHIFIIKLVRVDRWIIQLLFGCELWAMQMWI